MAARANSRSSTVSAGILAYRKGKYGLEVLLVHPGGPFWRNKDSGVWSIPKGEIDALNDPEQVARRTLNPGSAGRRRFKLPITLATLDVMPDGCDRKSTILKAAERASASEFTAEEEPDEDGLEGWRGWGRLVIFHRLRTRQP